MKKNLILIIFILFPLINFSPEKKYSPKLTQTRGFADTVGFSMTSDQIEHIINLSEKLEQDNIQANINSYQLNSGTKWIAGICPHDDHLLAGPVYVHLFQHLHARHIIIFGVAHKAWKWGIEDSLIFDSFKYWRGPYDKVNVSFLREEIISRLPAGDFIVNDDWQSEEHSVEGIIPFIQYYMRDAEIVSILVPYMNWDRIEKLSWDLAEVLSQVIQEKNLVLGKDIAFICSNDGDHYGDQDWGGKNLAPFGTDDAGYLKATQCDSNLIKTTLVGELQTKKLKKFTELVWGDDLRSYKITWCGRFSIPFGLSCVSHLMKLLNKASLNGYLLRYDNSYHLGKLPLENIGLGTTAPNTIRHWVGYCAIGYY
jgi:AmmeMemoRadiSam system protein B